MSEIEYPKIPRDEWKNVKLKQKDIDFIRSYYTGKPQDIDFLADYFHVRPTTIRYWVDEKYRQKCIRQADENQRLRMERDPLLRQKKYALSLRE